MNTFINFFRDINGNALYLFYRVKAYLNIDIDTMATLIIAIIFGIPFAAMIVYAVVLHRRGKKMGVIYDHSKEIDDESWKIDKSPLGPFLSDINEPPWDHYSPR